MNILFLDQYSELGGGQRCLLDVMPAIEQRGWRAHAAIPGNGPLRELLRARNVDVEDIPCGSYRSGSKSAADILRFSRDLPRQVRVIRGLLDREPFDLVYVNAARLLPAVALAAGSRVPVLFHVHFPIYGSAARLAGWSIRRTNATVVGCCRFVTKSLQRYIPRGRLRVVANGAADLGFQERSFGDKGRWRIGVVGRIAPEKGQVEFLRAAALLAPQFPGLRFVICGAPLWAARSYFDEVRRLASTLPVDFLDWQDDVAPVLAQLDMLVVPSGQEGMPRIILEAFSAGLPVVAFPVCGIPEAIEDEATGFLVPDASPQGLAGRIAGLISGDAGKLGTVALNARHEWERCYTVATYRNEIGALIEDLVGVSPQEEYRSHVNIPACLTGRGYSPAREGREQSREIASLRLRR